MGLAGEGKGHRGELQTSQNAQLKGQPAVGKGPAAIVSHYFQCSRIQEPDSNPNPSQSHFMKDEKRFQSRFVPA